MSSSFPGHLHGHGLASHRHRHNSSSSASSFGLSAGNNPADNLHGVGNGHPALNGPTALVDVHDDANDSRMNLGESADHNNTAPNSNHRNVRNLRLMAERRAGLQRWVNSSRARRHPVTRLLKRVALVTSICAPLMVAAWSGYLSVTDRLHEFYKGSLYDFVETHHIRVAGATTESVVATDRSLVAWQSELTRLRSELSKLAGGAVGEVDANNSQLEFETGRDAVGHRSVSTALLAHVLLMITCSLVRNPHIALSCVIMRENANICMTRNGPLHSAHTKNTTNKVYGTTFIQAGEEFTTDDELCRKPCFFIFRAVRTMCFSTLSTAFALGKGSSLGLGNRPPGLTQEAKTFSTTSHNVATLQPLLWGFGDFGGPQPLARRVQAGVKNNRALPKTVR